MGRPENRIETSHVKKVKSKGGRSYKFTSPGRRNVPDRLDLYPIESGHEELVGRYVRFTELKAPRKKARGAQLREHDRIRDLGFVVDVVDTKED